MECFFLVCMKNTKHFCVVFRYVSIAHKNLSDKRARGTVRRLEAKKVKLTVEHLTGHLAKPEK